MPRPSVCVVSRVAGLSAALSTRGLTGPWLRILDADKPDMNALASSTPGGAGGDAGNERGCGEVWFAPINKKNKYIYI